MTPLEAAAMAEEVAATGEIAGSVDLTAVSQQLDQVIIWQAAQFTTLWVLIGAVIGLAVAMVLGRFWR